MASSELRVHILIDSLAWGGAETLLADFAVGAQAAGIEVTAATLQAGAEAASRLRQVAAIEPVHVEVSSLLRPSDRRRVRDHIAAVAPDLVHTHLGHSDLLGGLAARRLGVPTVSTIHVMEWERDLRSRLRLGLMAAVRRRCAARVITVSEAARRSYLKTGWDRSDRVVAVHNGIVDGARPGSGGAVRRELGLGPDELVVAMVSVLRRGKGHDVGARAIAALSERFPHLRLLVLGDGPARAAIETDLAALGPRALMTGHRDDVLEVLDAVDVLVHPTSADAFPTALLEAMAARVPAIATEVGGVPEIIRDGETGILIPPPPNAHELASALEPLLVDPALRDRLGRRARKRYEGEFTAVRWFERLAPVYDIALSQRARARRRQRR